MAARLQSSGGSWLVVQELFESADPAFVDELCRFNDAETLGSFAGLWLKDRRPEARRFLSQYLNQPLNHFRHEALVKRLFKLAEEAGDDEVMAWMMVAFDRSIRRVVTSRYQYDWQTRESWEEETLSVPHGRVMPRNPRILRWFKDRASLRLFSLKTRRYLRRRSWRYFRKLGNRDPQRYLEAMVIALSRYTDQDVADGVALIDNWGMMHALFHDSPVLESYPVGWNIADDRSLGELAPAPAFLSAWKRDASPLLRLVSDANCRPVRQWCLEMLRSNHAEAIAQLDLETILNWLSGEATELAEFAAEILESHRDASQINTSDWVRLLCESNPAVLAPLARAAAEQIDPNRLSLREIVSVATQPSSLVATLGHRWLQARTLVTRDDCLLALEICEARSESDREALVGTVSKLIAASPSFDSDLAMDILDSRHADVRRCGWQWLLDEDRLRNDPSVWQRLIESPYDDIQLPLVGLLERELREPMQRRRDSATETRIGQSLGSNDLRRLWATVLLNTRRGSRRKPGVVRQIIEHLERHPDQLNELKPLLSISLRSIRSTEWKSVIAGITGIAARNPHMATELEEAFPELKLLAESEDR
ncbi:hypothetical protein [Roseiconus lacunae]|uniref:hypothetical protein n=1 Tax=Roseiconus lacunae TaxID=2605694 RepID=UPI0011F3FC1A|nr:hypothetical protein [Roseiconus lacunae]